VTIKWAPGPEGTSAKLTNSNALYDALILFWFIFAAFGRVNPPYKNENLKK